jgi:hypothetical protein
VAVLDELTGYFPAEHRTWSGTRSAVIAAHPELRERELLKREQLAAAVENALRAREIDDVTARLAAMISALALDAAYGRWLERADQREFGDLLADALRELVSRTVAFGGPGLPDGPIGGG